MSLSSPFIQRPVMTTLVMAGIVAFGAIAYRDLPVSDLPNIDFPTISVSASLPGASPETMASSVATPLEKQFSTIAGIDLMTSSSGLGSSSVTLQFTLDRNIDAAAADVNAAISQTLRSLPQGMLPPSYRKVDPSAQPILYYALRSKTLPLSQVDEYAQTLVSQQLSTVDGVAQVNVFGSQKYAVRVQLDPNALAAHKIGLDDVTRTIGSGNVNIPAGTLWGTEKAYSVQANGQLAGAQDFRPLVVAWRNGVPVRLEQLGKVLDAVQDTRQASWFNGERAITLGIQRQPGTNTVDVARRVKALMAQIQAQLPASVEVHILRDASTQIEDSVTDVKFTLALTIALVVLVIFLFLRNLPATVIPSLALPMSLVGTFAVMHLLHFNLDNLSLMALTLAVGFVVDDAIVVLENIVRHVEMGKTPMQAAFDGAAEIGFTVLSMTISLVAVFIPILFMGGLIGRLFSEFAVTIGVSILVSGFVSLTLTPMLCSRFLSAHGHQASSGPLARAFESGWNAVHAGYERSLRWVMAHRPLSVAFSVAILAGTGVLAVVVKKGFIPSEDQGFLFIPTETLEGTSFDAMVQHQNAVASIVGADPNVDAYMSAVGGMGGGSGGGSISQGRIMLRLKPRSERAMGADEIARSISRKASAVPGIRIYAQNPPAINLGGRASKSQYQYTMRGSDLPTLYEASRKLEARLRQLPALTDVATDLQIRNPEVTVTIDRDRAASLGLNAGQVIQGLYDAYGARQVSTIFTPNNQYWVILELLPEYQRDLSALDKLYIHSPQGDLVPLSSLARIEPATGPLQVNHTGQLPSVTLSFNIAPGFSLGDGVQQIAAAAREVLPASIATNFAGTAQAFADSQKGLLGLLIIAILVIYLVLGILYESFIHPVTILTGLPFAGFGALLTLWLFRMELDIYAFVGIIMLVGLVKKNAIMMIDFAIEAERTHGLTPAAAITEACLVRFRPIMMTTMCALMGTLPIALGAGAGAESRRPLGVAVVGGLAFSQAVTLYVTPVFYTYFDELRAWFGSRGRKPAAAVLPAADGAVTAEA